ncbi:hypothetical protein Tco_1017714 [Tanacetum coccineum]|uniref:Retrovirus-related Pol polyprotein from transposon TNT 1-94 n=1 Tax=Tanacetum coccineum TaxID=301880 RepID=A0ABQ5FSN7_9ASTR
MCHIIGIEPQFENIIKNGPFIPMTTGQRKPEGQWTAYERKAVNLYQKLKSLIMSVLPDDQMNSVINCLTVKSTWDDLIPYHEGPSDAKESRVMDLKYKALMNELVNDGIKLSKLEISTGFINKLPKKWLSFYQSLKNTIHIKDVELASLFGKLKYEENIIYSIYKIEKNKSLVSATPLSTGFISTSTVQDLQDSPDDEEDTRSSHEYLNDIEEEFQARALLAKSKRFFKNGTQRFCSAKVTDQTECHKCGKKELRPTKDFKAKYNKVKAKLALLSSSASASKAVTVKNKGLIAEAYEWDKEEVSSDDNEMVELSPDLGFYSWYQSLMALDLGLIRASGRSEKAAGFLINLPRKHLDGLQQLMVPAVVPGSCWCPAGFNKVNQCISEQIPTQKKSILGVDQLTEDPSSSGKKDPVFVKSSANDTKVSIHGVKKPWLSETEGFILPNHDTGRILQAESQRNPIDPLVYVTDSSATAYDSVDESLVCITPLPPLKKLDGAEPISGPKTIKLILKSKSTFKAKALKGVIINEPSSAPARVCDICKSYDHDTHGHNMIISLRRGIKPRNPQHVMKSYETCGSTVDTTTDHNDIEWFRRGEALQAKKLKL